MVLEGNDREGWVDIDFVILHVIVIPHLNNNYVRVLIKASYTTRLPP